MILVGICSGIGVAAGTFAFLLVIRVIPRMVQKAKLEHKVIYIENIVFRGILFGTVLSLFSWKKKWLFTLLGRSILTIFGFSAGIFVGCLAVALAEILDTFPIFFRRIQLKEDFGEVLLFVMAMGKMIGSLFYFLTGYDTIIP
jgi:stage V sporulation protein AB